MSHCRFVTIHSVLLVKMTRLFLMVVWIQILASAQSIDAGDEQQVGLSMGAGADGAYCERRLRRLELRFSEFTRYAASLGCRCRDNCEKCNATTGRQLDQHYQDEQVPPTSRGSGFLSFDGLPKRSAVHRNINPEADDTRRPRQRRSQQGGQPSGWSGRDGLDGVPGLDGAPGLDGVPGADGRNGRDGLDGRDGKDGKDGQPGEQGPVGPAGPPGEPGRRGKPGPPGKQGPPGPAGVCAYMARYDCGALKDLQQSSSKNSEQLLGALLMAPTIIGYDSKSPAALLDPNENERQVTVNEGDNIQLSCEASGQPKPSYIWRKAQDKGSATSTILYDVGTNLRINSYPGGQLPLSRVDRLQAGNYECVASNGVLPNAVKRLALDVNYAPTIRIYPAPSLRRVHLGSSVLVECIVDANPPAFSYWTFGSDSLMSVAGAEVAKYSLGGQANNDTRATSSVATRLGGADKYIITESAGQLNTGTYYTVLTLNITRVTRDDFGLYKCNSRNLLAQSSGYFILDGYDEPKQPVVKLDESRVEGSIEKRLDSSSGWPDYLIEREASYVTFGNEHRRVHLNASGGDMQQADIRIDMSSQQQHEQQQMSTFPSSSHPPYQTTPFIHDDKSTPISTDGIKLGGTVAKSNQFERRLHHQWLSGGKVLDNEQIEKSAVDKLSVSSINRYDNGKTYNTPASNISNSVVFVANATPSHAPEVGRDDNDTNNNNLDSNYSLDESDLCQIEDIQRLIAHDYESGRNSSALKPARRSSIKLLDQVGKPVYIGNSYERGLPLSWWSLDSKLQIDTSATTDAAKSSHYYATSVNDTKHLFEYGNLNDLLKDKQNLVDFENSLTSDKDGTTHQAAAEGNSVRNQVHRLLYNSYGNSHVIFNRQFFYISQANSSEPSLQALELVVYNTTPQNATDLSSYKTLKLDANLSPRFKNQPLNLGPEYQLNRVEIASDENGVWLVIPTIEKRSFKPFGDGADTNVKNQTQHTVSREYESNLVRRLHVMRVDAPRESNGTISIVFHAHMKLDWRMIGQVFIIDGVLYSVKDRHMYSSKLQFAYDLYRCKLLSTDYLNEPHRTFTNHFGDTQMIKYNPNDPKRLYTVDSGNLLWCPVKLLEMNPDDI